MTRKDVEDLIAAAAARKPMRFGDQEIPVPVNLHGADLKGEDLSGLDLRGANLHGADLSGCDLAGAKLAGANLHGANLEAADLGDCDLSETNLHEAKLMNVVTTDKTCFDRSNLHGADKKGLTGGATFKDANVTDIKG